MSNDQHDPAARLSPSWSEKQADQAPDAMPTFPHAPPELLSSLSHELRTPLHTLNGFLEIVLDYDVGPLTEQQREYLTYARTSAQQLTTLIEDGFILLRGEEDAHLQQEEAISLATLLSAAIQVVTPAVTHKRIHLVREIPGDLPGIHADQSRMQLAIQSILGAALDSAREDTACSIQVVAENRWVVCDITVEIADGRVEPMRALIDAMEGHAAEARLDGRGIQLAAARLILRQHWGTLSLALEPTGQFAVCFALPSA